MINAHYSFVGCLFLFNPGALLSFFTQAIDVQVLFYALEVSVAGHLILAPVGDGGKKKNN